MPVRQRDVAWLLLSAAVALSFTVAVTVGQQRRSGAFDQSINHPAIKYLTADTDTVVDRLNQKLRDGSAKLVFDEKTGYLKSVLDLLQVPVESQVMVYTQTSLQAQHIRMNNPRAIYFNDTVSVGYIRGAGLIEVMAQDPKMGSIFYVIHQVPADAGDLRPRSAVPALSPVVGHARRARPERADDVPAQERDRLRQRRLRRSLQADRRALGRLVCDRQESAGASHGQPSADHAEADRRAAARARRSRDSSISSATSTPYSDIVALMVLEHQAHFSNLVTRATWETRLGEAMRIAEAADALADYMLFVDEAKIPGGGIEGSSGFAEKFIAAGPKDAKGRSLRELDLKTRLQKYPLSYMIYSPAFRALPEAPKNLVMGKIDRVLSGEITGPEVRAPDAAASRRDP